MRIPIKAVREFTRKHKLTHVVVFGYDGKSQHVATYGRSVESCGQAADFGNKIKNALGWPDILQVQPSRVRRLKADNMRLKERIRVLEAELADERGELK